MEFLLWLWTGVANLSESFGMGYLVEVFVDTFDHLFLGMTAMKLKIYGHCSDAVLSLDIGIFEIGRKISLNRRFYIRA